ncbi:hypothetical protein BUALT_Bualt09G0094200 [Buddleja alternifolia]|uniref:Uncharacterized protein n=1 Tax=Buddleja alternifolia TaxID=168488 RepID=A0AAV6X5K2_9LAMI|nr:hypothetical protein BUALT_Bualt09G0094200 [Buddleja alternifolia]
MALKKQTISNKIKTLNLISHFILPPFLVRLLRSFPPCRRRPSPSAVVRLRPPSSVSVRRRPSPSAVARLRPPSPVSVRRRPSTSAVARLRSPSAVYVRRQLQDKVPSPTPTITQPQARLPKPSPFAAPPPTKLLSATSTAAPPDFPPESFWLSKDAEIDWFDRNAFYERKESTKGNSHSTNLNPHINPSSNSNSQRFSVNLKSKASIIGLPKSQKATFADSKRRTCKPASVRLFPKRSGSIGKSTVPVVEPGSPKVSCMGRVKSKRCRRRSNSIKRSEKPVEKPSEKQKTGLYSKVLSMFRSKKGHKKTSRSGSRKMVEVVMEEPVVLVPQRSVSVKVREIPVSYEPVPEPPGLGGMKRGRASNGDDDGDGEGEGHYLQKDGDDDEWWCGGGSHCR